jgi:hypothetical protein
LAINIASAPEVINHRGSIALFMMIKPWLRWFLVNLSDSAASPVDLQRSNK